MPNIGKYEGSEYKMTTKRTLERIAENTENRLTKEVVSMVLDCSYDDLKQYMDDVLQHGCQSGMVGGLIYYSDTKAFYQNFKEEINTLLYELMSDTGEYSPKGMFGDKWDEEDPLALFDLNQNLLAWFGFEETVRQLMDEIDNSNDDEADEETEDEDE
jgi:hypothetical protein